MISRTNSTITALALALMVSAGCVKGRKTQNADDTEIPDQPVDLTPVEAQRSTATMLEVRVDLQDDGVLLHIAGIPNGSTLECDLDQVPLVPCHDGALFAKPSAGDHRISVKAMAQNTIAAIGSSAPFTVLPGQPNTAPQGGETLSRESLTLIVDDASFKNGMTHPYSKDFKVSFRLAGAPACEAQIKCRYDSRTSPFWTECDEGGRSFSIDKDLIASGLQFVSVQAGCQDQLGPVLNMFFFGVPDDYRPLMLRELKDGQGRHIVNLIKSDDCPENEQRYECASRAEDPFELCANGNVIDMPAAGYRVRLACGSTKGPDLTLNPL